MQRKCPRLAENAARGPSSAENVEVARPYRKDAFAPRKKNRRSTNHSSCITLKHPESEPRNEAPWRRFLPNEPCEPAMPLGSSPQQSTWRAFRMSARQTTQTIDSASLPDNLPSELSERSTRRVARTIHSASHPNGPTDELPKPFFVLLASTNKPECRDATGEFETHIAVAP